MRDHDSELTLVFAYGSNLDPVRMADRVASARVVGCARLDGFELRFHKRGSQDGTGKANAFPSDAGRAAVHGVVYEIAWQEIVALDAHEGGYERRLLRMPLDGRVETIEAWVYLARPETIDDALTPEPWYLDHVLIGARTHGLPGTLVEELNALRASLPSP